MLWNQSSHMYACGTMSDYLNIHTFTTTKQKQITSHPPLLFSFHWTPSTFRLLCVSLHPAASSVHSQQPPPPSERGLMRANDGNACCCFPFINRSQLVHRHTAFHHQQSANSAGPSFLFHLSPTRSVSYPSPLLSLKWSGFSPFPPPLNLYFSSSSLAVLSLTTTPSSMKTSVLMGS